jgi:hypothetical protein
VLGGVLLLFAVLGLVSVAVGVYYTLAESFRSGWFPPILIGVFGIAVLLMGVVGFRALRIKTVEEIEEQNSSKWLKHLQSPNTSMERTREE